MEGKGESGLGGDCPHPPHTTYDATFWHVLHPWLHSFPNYILLSCSIHLFIIVHCLISSPTSIDTHTLPLPPKTLDFKLLRQGLVFLIPGVETRCKWRLPVI